MSVWQRSLRAALFLMMVSAAQAAAVEVEQAPQNRQTAAPPGPAPSAGGTRTLEGPPPPVPPDVITRDADGRVTLRAVRIDRPLRIDGRLDEEVFSAVPAAGDFVQQQPREGEPVTEKTETWVLFDDENLYVVARCWDDHLERWTVTELRRDAQNIFQNENLAVVLDTFYDRRNGFMFQTTPLGAIHDQTSTDEKSFNSNWNTVWEVKTGRFDGGWTVEMAIPFKSLRYQGSGPQVWSINFRRIVRWKNEISFLTRVPVAYGEAGVIRMSIAATLVGLETPAQSMNLELKPFVISAVTTDRAATSPFSNRFSRDAGFDFKYGLTRSLIADATYNTDFAQVEEDVQQVNLTRFSLLFPEKRDFFLEGQGVFGFGGGFGIGAITGDVPTLFFSRRIGLSQGQAVPVVAGGRLTGTLGKFGIGVLNVQTDDKPSAGVVATNFSVVRLKRNILRRSNVGLLATVRAPAANTSGSNQVVGADWNLAFFQNLTINGYYAETHTPDAGGDESSYRGSFDYAGDRYGLQLEHLLVGGKFNPEVGFLRRGDFRRDTIGARFSPRPKSNRVIRRLNWNGTYDYITNGGGTRLENRKASGTFQIDFHNNDQLTVDYDHDFEYLPRNFQIARGVVLPIGSYKYDTVRTSYLLGQQRHVSGLASLIVGSFYDGHKKEANLSAGRISLSSRLNVEPGVALNWVDLPQGRFKTRLITARALVTPSPRMLVSGLFQYNSADRTLSSSVRLRWEYTPGSDLFIVYSDGRNTAVGGLPDLVNRSVAIKLTRLFRF